jgi:AcrR family transcriptional regulator
MKTDIEPRRLRADAARNRQALIDAAQRLFSTRGLSVTLDDIAEEAGVNVATAYRNFRNKHELTDAFLAQRFEQIAAIAEDAAALDDPWQGLTSFLSGLLRLVAEDRGLHDVFDPSGFDQRVAEMESRLEPLVQGMLARGQRAGVIRRDIQTGDLGVIIQMLSTIPDIPNGDTDVLLDRYLQLTMSALRPGDARLPGAPPALADLRAVKTAPARGRPASRRASAHR